MTLAGIKTTRKEIEGLVAMLPVRSGPSQETMEFLARFTTEELIKISDILDPIENRGGDIVNDDEYTEEEKTILIELLSRPIVPLPPIDYIQPRCRACGQQPTLDDNDVCARCWQDAGGNFDLEQFIRDGHATRNEHGTIQLWVS